MQKKGLKQKEKAASRFPPVLLHRSIVEGGMEMCYMEERKLKSERFSAKHQGDSYTAEAQSRTGDLGYCGSGFSVQSGGYKRAAQRLL